MCGNQGDFYTILGKRLNSSQGLMPSSKIGLTTTICQCKNCGLIFSNPQPIPIRISDHYGVPPESYWKEEYFKSDPNYFKSEISRIKQLIKFKKGMRSLDIGAGIGKQMIALENAGFDSFGFEPSKPFRERAISKMGIHENRIKLGMIEEVEYEDSSFDFISFGAVLEHLYDPSACIKKAISWLKEGGLIHIEVPSSNWLWHKLINLYYKITFSGFVGNLSPMHEPYHLYEFSIKSFEKNAIPNNYEIAFYEYFVCAQTIPGKVRGLLAPVMKKTNTGLQLTVWLRKI